MTPASGSDFAEAGGFAGQSRSFKHGEVEPDRKIQLSGLAKPPFEDGYAIVRAREQQAHALRQALAAQRLLGLAFRRVRRRGGIVRRCYSVGRKSGTER